LRKSGGSLSVGQDRMRRIDRGCQVNALLKALAPYRKAVKVPNVPKAE
jgi:hypothetical protein